MVDITTKSRIEVRMVVSSLQRSKYVSKNISTCTVEKDDNNDKAYRHFIITTLYPFLLINRYKKAHYCFIISMNII
jgi:hypothetical protein